MARKSNIKKVTVPCGLCGSTDFVKLASGTDIEYTDTTDDEFTFVQCKKCHLIYLNPRPHESELGSIYPEVYHSYHLSGEETRGIATRVRQWVYSQRLKKGLRGLWGRDIELLDVGCGDGWMLDCYRNIGQGRIKTYGVEITPIAYEITKKKGHQAYLGRFEDIDFGGQKFDFINISHVIEHVGSPKDMLKKAKSLLKPGGRIVLETPNIKSIDGRLFKNTWGAYHYPRHWFLYDPQTIDATLQACGLGVSRMYFNACPVHWHWSLYRLFSSRPYLRPFKFLFSPNLIFKGGLVTFSYLSIFTAIDQVIKFLRIPTSNMMVVAEVTR